MKKHNTSILVNIAAYWFLVTFWHMPGIIATTPIIVIGLIKLVQNIKHLTKNSLDKWTIMVLLNGTYVTLSNLYYKAELQAYEEVGKYLLTVLIFLGIKSNTISIKTIINAMLTNGLLVAIYLANYEATSEGFTVMGSTVKFGNSLALIALATASLIINHNKKIINTALLSSMTVIIIGLIFTGSRAALIATTIGILIILRKGNTKTLIAVATTILISIMIIGTYDNYVRKKIELTIQDIEQISQDNYSSSIGYRIMMIRAASYNISENIIFGKGNIIPIAIKEYSINANTPGLRKAAKEWSTQESKLHNIYLDSIFTKGIIGLLLLTIMLYTGARKEKNKIAMTPAIIIAISGLFDSTISLSVIIDYYLIATLIYRKTYLA